MQIKPVSLRGTGKHKCSFQRVEVPSLSIHFCDCEEHSDTTHTDKQKSLCNYDSKDGGMDEKELNIMNSVLNRIFERENYSEETPRDFKLSKKVQSSNGTVDHLQNDKNLVNQEMVNDDNLILNVVAGANDRMIMVKDPIQEAMTAIQANEDFVDQEMDDDDDNLIINVVAGAKDRNTMFKDPTLEAIVAIQVHILLCSIFHFPCSWYKHLSLLFPFYGCRVNRIRYPRNHDLLRINKSKERRCPQTESVKHLQRLKMVRHIRCCLKLKQSRVWKSHEIANY